MNKPPLYTLVSPITQQHYYNELLNNLYNNSISAVTDSTLRGHVGQQFYFNTLPVPLNTLKRIINTQLLVIQKQIGNTI